MHPLARTFIMYDLFLYFFPDKILKFLNILGQERIFLKLSIARVINLSLS
jgi:hypothetical protein